MTAKDGGPATLWWSWLTPEARYGAVEARAQAHAFWTAASLVVLGHVLGFSTVTQVVCLLTVSTFHFWLAHRLPAVAAAEPCAKCAVWEQEHLDEVRLRLEMENEVERLVDALAATDREVPHAEAEARTLANKLIDDVFAAIPPLVKDRKPEHQRALVTATIAADAIRSAPERP